jgi:hypothetical protein
MLSWGSDDLGVEKEIDILKSVFEVAYHYDNVTHWKIPDQRPGHEASAQIAKFLEQDGDQNNLLILYYAGHAMPNVNHHGLPTWFPKLVATLVRTYWSCCVSNLNIQPSSRHSEVQLEHDPGLPLRG